MFIETFTNLIGMESSVNSLYWILQLLHTEPRRQKLLTLLRFHSSSSEKMISLKGYVSRMKPSQSHIFFIAGANSDEVQNLPSVEHLVARGYEILYLFEAVDELDDCSISLLPEFNGKKFQNIAEDEFQMDTSDDDQVELEAMTKQFEPLTKWFNDVGLKGYITQAVVSLRLQNSSSALVANDFGCSGKFCMIFSKYFHTFMKFLMLNSIFMIFFKGNMERLVTSNAHEESDNQISAENHLPVLEINPRHPIIEGMIYFFSIMKLIS